MSEILNRFLLTWQKELTTANTESFGLIYFRAPGQNKEMTNPQELSSVERFLLLLLYASIGEKKTVPITGDIWLQKEMFAISRNQQELADEASFEDFRFGCFSEVVETIKQQYESSKLLVKSEDNRIQLTPKGKELAEKTWRSSSIDDRKLAQDIKEQFNDMSYWELLLFMYVTYPETALSSEVKGDVLKRRHSLAISLYKKGKVSLEKAAELSGRHLDNFIQEMELSKRETDLPAIG